jgi:L-threonylcarbamoyladenylate synthase
MSAPLEPSDARRLQECVVGGGVAVFPTDTVYGVCCDPENEDAVRRLYELKGRPAERPAAVMFFDLRFALAALPELTSAERAALGALLPGAVTLLLANRAARFTAAGGPQPGERQALGLRVPRLAGRLAALGSVRVAVMQSSANLSGQPDAREVADIPASLLAGADLVLDAGELAGRPSTVIDLREYDRGGRFSIVREGAVSRSEVERILVSC